MTPCKPVVLCILDGWGLSDAPLFNAPRQAQTPNFDRIWADCPHATLATHGRDVGLPEGQMGNSEVGHMNIGAGRVVAMDLFAVAPAVVRLIAALKRSGGRAHLVGVISDGGVHGHIAHVLAAARVLTGAGVPVAVHALTDGRDVAPESAGHFLAELSEALPEGARIATVIGRYYAMDRDKRWERVKLAFDAMVHARGERAETAEDAVAEALLRDETDEFIRPTVLAGHGGIRDGGFEAFDTGRRPRLAVLTGMVDYSVEHDAYMDTVFPKRQVENTLGAWVAKHGLRQFRLAETEKYPHVTFFLNGGKETPEPGEDRFTPQSPKVATYDLAPEMAAAEVTGRLVEAIGAGYDLIVVNYANPDMVGHTGSLPAAIAACEAVDRGLGRALAALEAAGGAMIVTADHGNCETMQDPETGGPHTAHTTNPVPVILV
ncbi:MAG: 2,3-bisphosphoglycerate-independent phosphoglycerate mutase, partial [Alphaproteobacteria bacterium HGW-Alphaproteobacteria-2]